MNAIRAVLDVQRVQQLLSQNALVVRGTPDQIALAEKLVDDLDKARPEVIVDIAVIAGEQRQVAHPGIQPADQRHRHSAEQYQHHDTHYHYHDTTTTHYREFVRTGAEYSGQFERDRFSGGDWFRQPCRR